MSINFHTRMGITQLVLWGLLTVQGPVLAQQTVATVGPDGSVCDFRPENSLGDPIGTALLDAGSFDEIRIVRLDENDVLWDHSEDLNIARSVTLRGGFDSCADAELGIENTSAVTSVDAKNGRFLSISGNSSVEVRIRRISSRAICNAFDESPVEQGGVIHVDGAVRVTLEKSTITGSRCDAAPVEEGGLIFLSGGTDFRVADSSVLQSGHAGNGGAIFCETSPDLE